MSVKVKLPSFLKDVKLTKAEELKYAGICRNWLTINEYLVLNKDDPKKVNVGVILKLMHYEFTHSKRGQSLTKLHGKLTTYRRNEERDDMVKLNVNLNR